jgi:PhoH-like ATPase
MTPRTPGKARLFVLDTNVLMHDPSAIFRFEEHDVFLPMVVLEELDAAKKGSSEVARNARQASRTLDGLLHGADAELIELGLPIPRESSDLLSGQLFFQTSGNVDALPAALPGNKPDNAILAAALTLTAERENHDVIVVSKDINLRIKAHVLGLHAEDYLNDRGIEDVDLLPTGVAHLDNAAWENDIEVLETGTEDTHTWYDVKGETVASWHPNLCLAGTCTAEAGTGAGAGAFDTLVTIINGDHARLRVARDHSRSTNAVWGICSRNLEQNFALNLLMDPTIDMVTLLGTAGTGKTLLALAAGLSQTLEGKIYREIVVTRATIPVGEDIGFLPGTEEEKMEPWMGALMDNLEVLTEGDSQRSQWGRAATNDLLHSRIKIRSPSFMRGRTFLNRYLIIDEAQNLTSKQLKTLLTRAGPGTKVVCIGNLSQIDTPYLTETTSGLTRVVDRFRAWPHAGHVTLRRGERSRLADAASEFL